MKQILLCCSYELKSHRVTSSSITKSDTRRDNNEKRLLQKRQVPSMPNPGCSVPHFCSLLSENVTEWLKVYCVTAEEKRTREVQCSDSCLSGIEWPLFCFFPRFIALHSHFFTLVFLSSSFHFVLMPHEDWYSLCCSSSLLIQVPCLLAEVRAPSH